ncbi:MAG: hypothetical protein WAS51_07025, partial [Ilumatobacteraceae bacterium]
LVTVIAVAVVRFFVGCVFGGLGLLVAPADEGAESVEVVDRSHGLGFDLVVVADVGVAVVEGAQQSSVELAGLPAVTPGRDVVDVATLHGLVAA